MPRCHQVAVWHRCDGDVDGGVRDPVAAVGVVAVGVADDVVQRKQQRSCDDAGDLI